MDPRLFLKLAPERQLRMTFALRQALQVLQMTQLELSQWLNEEIEKNPLLELNPLSPSKRFEFELPFKPTLHEHLQNQIRENFSSTKERNAALLFLEHLDERGLLTSLPENIPEPYAEKILSILQTFDPPGIFARSLQETLLLQLKVRGKSNALSFKLIQNYFDDLLHSRFTAIKKKLQVSDLSLIMSDLVHLSFRPAESFRQEPITPIYPDLVLEKGAKGWTLELTNDELPKIHIQTDYLSIDPKSEEEKEVLREFKTQAQWIFRTVARRRKLIRAIGKILVCKQTAFLDQKGPLVSITMKELSEQLEIHESTLSRALAGKYISTPRGIFPLRSLIVNDPGMQTAKQVLRQLIQNEDKNHPLTDDDLAKKLQAKGFPVARRTIAKYRTNLKIGPATRRKSLGNR